MVHVLLTSIRLEHVPFHEGTPMSRVHISPSIYILIYFLCLVFSYITLTLHIYMLYVLLTSTRLEQVPFHKDTPMSRVHISPSIYILIYFLCLVFSYITLTVHVYMIHVLLTSTRLKHVPFHKGTPMCF